MTTQPVLTPRRPGRKVVTSAGVLEVGPDPIHDLYWAFADNLDHLGKTAQRFTRLLDANPSGYALLGPDFFAKIEKQLEATAAMAREFQTYAKGREAMRGVRRLNALEERLAEPWDLGVVL